MRRLFAFVALAVALRVAAQNRPNILVIWGDDVGWFNINVYNDGMMGYQTLNIDRIMNVGIRFTDAYGNPAALTWKRWVRPFPSPKDVTAR